MLIRGKLGRDPRNWKLAYLLFKKLNALGEREGALKAIELAAKNPESPISVRLTYARKAWEVVKKPSVMIREIVRTALENDPSDPDANWLQARIFYVDGKMEAAHERIMISLIAQPENAGFIRLRDRIKNSL